MQHKSVHEMACPIARSPQRIGEWWSILILRGAFAGTSRFGAYQKNSGIAPTRLIKRPAALVEAGALERRRYTVRPPRGECQPTERGRDFRTVIPTPPSFGRRHFAPWGGSVRLVDATTGTPADPMPAERRIGRPLIGPHYKLAPGPASTEATKARLAARNAKPLPPHISKECLA